MCVNIQTVNALSTHTRILYGAVVRQGRLKEFALWVDNCFTGHATQLDREVFDQFYAAYRDRIQLYQDEIAQNKNLLLNLSMTQKLLEAEARFKVSLMEPSLRDYKPFQQFSKVVEELREIAAQHVGGFASPLEKKCMKEEIRWIHSNAKERLFAARRDGRLPLKYKDIPAGSIILYNPEGWKIKNIMNKGLKHALVKCRWIMKGFFCRLFTGKPYTHAELAIGGGRTLDLDKKEGTLLDGQLIVKDYKDRFCPFDVLSPKEDTMVQAHNHRFHQQKVDSFDALMQKVVHEGESHAAQIEAGAWDIMKVALNQAKRSCDYDCTGEWVPGKNRFACSSTIAALFGKFGIDIGKELNKKVIGITPADYTKSSFFTVLYGC